MHSSCKSEKSLLCFRDCEQAHALRAHSPDLPPFFSNKQISLIIMELYTAFAMSSMVSNAVLTATSASISTPVWPLDLAVEAQMKPRSATPNYRFTEDRGRGGQGGITYDVFLEPTIPDKREHGR